MSRTPRFSPTIAFALWILSGNRSQAFSSNSFPVSSLSYLGSAVPISTAPTLGRTRGGLIAMPMSSSSSSSSTSVAVPTWDDLKSRASETPVGRALDRDLELRKSGKGSPHVHSKLRLFEDSNSGDDLPVFTLYRDHAGWCPYCQKTMLLIEAKEIPIKIELVNMRSYGDKPRSFLQKVPNGMLPALEDARSGNVALDSAYIMEFLEGSHPSPEFKRMVPSPKEQPEDQKRYKYLMGLERELFSWWCTLVFRSEQPNGKAAGNTAAAMVLKLMKQDGKNTSNDDDDDETYVSPSMRAFLECMETVDTQLKATKGPYFLDYADHPTMIDFVFASHIERMLASCSYWKGMDLRNPSEYPKLSGLRAWMDALEKHEYYLAFQSDYYTHVKDIPPQYGPGSGGVSRFSKIEANQANIEGRGTAWKLPLEDDEALQPLYRGIPLPKCVLSASGITADADGSYTSTGSSPAMKEACQAMAAWKICGNGPKVAVFAARGGPKGAKNIRKTFGAELADPNANPDDSLVEPVDAVLRLVAEAMLEGEANALPEQARIEALQAVAGGNASGVASSLAYLRDRIGVPRDLPLASARYLRAYLNWAIDVLVSQ